MEKVSLCRGCLNVNVHHTINNTPLEEVYEKLTGMPTNDTRSVSVCYMCYAQLLRTHKFKLACLRAEDLLTKMLNQLVKTEEEVDDKANLIEILSQSSALSVSPIVTMSTTDDDVKSEHEDIIKQELIDAQDDQDDHDVDTEDLVSSNSSHSSSVRLLRFQGYEMTLFDKESEDVDILNDTDCDDVTVAHKTAQDTLRERDRSLAVSCQSDKSRGVRAITASAGGGESKDEDILVNDDTDEEVDVVTLESQFSRNGETIIPWSLRPGVRKRLVSPPKIKAISRRRTRRTGLRGRRSYADVELVGEFSETNRRSIHNDMERQRRGCLTNLFDELRKQIPLIKNKHVPKVLILKQATALCRKLRQEDMEREKLKKKRAQLDVKLKKIRAAC